jgi:hypothetical protein
MKKILLLYLIGIHLAPSQCEAQDSCRSIGSYSTDSIGNENEKIIAPLIFNITYDSVIVYPGGNPSIPFLTFKILSKSCDWNKKLSEGRTIFKLLLKENEIEKYPTLNLIYLDQKYRVIELLYENSEKRIFTIATSSY